ncbi:MAG: beta-ketoacyl-[acyl-carrier-protein] synthase family protein [Phycisphaerales bacterium JB052]
MRSHSLITGLGPVCALGLGPDAFWQSLLQGVIGIKPIQSLDPSGFHVQIAGEVRDANIREFVPKSYRKATKVMARDTELAVIAAKLAADDAGLKTRGSEDDAEGFTLDPARTGCQIGAGLIAAETEELARAVVSAQDDQGRFSMDGWGTEGQGKSGMNNLPPLWLLKYLPNMLACHVTIIHGLEGPSNTIMGAEASALLSIGESARVIERGSADICFTGGAESRINHLGLLRWEYAARLTPVTRDDDPTTVCKPYQPDSRGGLIGEAGGMLIIESQQHAQVRGAEAYARIIGFGAAQTPRPYIPATGSMREHDEIDRGLSAGISHAMRDAGIGPDEIDAVFTLGIGEPTLDEMELGAIADALGTRAEDIPIATLVHITGNTMAGHAGLLTAAGALCLKNQQIPRSMVTRNDNAPVDSLRRVLVCSPSLGGQAGALILEQIS